MSGEVVEPKVGSRARSLAALLARPLDAWLAARALAWLAVLPLLKRTVALQRLARIMWLRPKHGRRGPDRETRTIAIVARLSHTSGGNCLERSLVLYRYLSRAGADPHLVVGMTRPGEYLGHVWVTVDDVPLLETTEALDEYEVVTTFADEGKRLG